jgi:protein-disulfide isomerase
MSRGVAPAGDARCEVPFEKNHELAQRFGARGTPAVFVADGRMLGGFVAADRIEEAFGKPAASK